MNLGGPEASRSPSASPRAVLAHQALVLSGPELDDGDPTSRHLPYVVLLEGVAEDLVAPLQQAVGWVGGTAEQTDEPDRQGSRQLVLGLRTDQLVAFRAQMLTKSERMLRVAEEIVTVARAWHRREFTLRCGPMTLACGPRPLIMGIVNCSPDSFYADSTATGDAAVKRGLEMVQDGADLIDVGGESTRPGSSAVDAAEERSRIEPVIRRLADEAGVPISVDTTKADVAEAAIDSGATMVNDISGATYEPRLAEIVARARVALVLMHMRGSPGQMYGEADYDDVAAEVCRELRLAMTRARAAGVDEDQIVVDPGIGFAKRAQHSLAMLNRLTVMRSLGRPILVGPSRKSFIGGVLDLPPEQRLEGTAAAVAVAVHSGAHIVRVHDVREMRRAAGLAAAIRAEGAVWTS